MSLALMSSGGKDSTLALDRARRQGRDVRYLVNVYDGIKISNGSASYNRFGDHWMVIVMASCTSPPVTGANITMEC